jgi:hypothetical protein
MLNPKELPEFEEVAKKMELNVVHIRRTQPIYGDPTDPNCLLYVWNDVPSHLHEHIDWSKVAELVERDKIPDDKRNNSRADYGYCGVHNPTRTVHSDGIRIPHLHTRTDDPIVIGLFKSLTQVVCHINRTCQLNIYVNDDRTSFAAEAIDPENILEAITATRLLPDATLLFPDKLNPHVDKNNCSTPSHSWAMALIRNIYHSNDNTFERVGLHGYGKKAVHDYMQNYKILSPAVKAIVSFYKHDLPEQAKRTSADYLSTDTTKQFETPLLDKNAQYYQAYGHEIEAFILKHAPSDPLRMAAGLVQCSVLCAHRPEQFVTWIREVSDDPLKVNSIPMHDQPCDSFVHDFYKFIHNRLTIIKNWTAEKIATKTISECSVPLGYTVSKLRMQPAWGGFAEQTLEQFKRGTDTLVNLVLECRAKHAADPNFFQKHVCTAVDLMSTLLSRSNPANYDPALEPCGMFGVQPLSSQLVIGICVRLGLMPACLGCHSRITENNWSKLCILHPTLKLEGVEPGKRADDLLKAIAFMIGCPHHTNMAEELCCLYISHMGKNLGKKADVAIPNIPNAWVLYKQQEVWVGPQPGSPHATKVVCVISLPNQVLPNGSFFDKQLEGTQLPPLKQKKPSKVVPLQCHFPTANIIKQLNSEGKSVTVESWSKKLPTVASKIVIATYPGMSRFQFDPIQSVKFAITGDRNCPDAKIFYMRGADFEVEGRKQQSHAAGLKVRDFRGRKRCVLFPDPKFPLYPTNCSVRHKKTNLRYFWGKEGHKRACRHACLYFIFAWPGQSAVDAYARNVLLPPTFARQDFGEASSLRSVTCFYLSDKRSNGKVPCLAAMQFKDNHKHEGGMKYHLCDDAGIQNSECLVLPPPPFLSLKSSDRATHESKRVAGIVSHTSDISRNDPSYKGSTANFEIIFMDGSKTSVPVPDFTAQAPVIAHSYICMMGLEDKSPYKGSALHSKKHFSGHMMPFPDQCVLKWDESDSVKKRHKKQKKANKKKSSVKLPASFSNCSGTHASAHAKNAIQPHTSHLPLSTSQQCRQFRNQCVVELENSKSGQAMQRKKTHEQANQKKAQKRKSNMLSASFLECTRKAAGAHPKKVPRHTSLLPLRPTEQCTPDSLKLAPEHHSSPQARHHRLLPSVTAELCTAGKADVKVHSFPAAWCADDNTLMGHSCTIPTAPWISGDVSLPGSNLASLENSVKMIPLVQAITDCPNSNPLLALPNVADDVAIDHPDDGSPVTCDASVSEVSALAKSNLPALSDCTRTADTLCTVIEDTSINTLSKCTEQKLSNSTAVTMTNTSKGDRSVTDEVSCRDTEVGQPSPEAFEKPVDFEFTYYEMPDIEGPNIENLDQITLTQSPATCHQSGKKKRKVDSSQVSSMHSQLRISVIA